MTTTTGWGPLGSEEPGVGSRGQTRRLQDLQRSLKSGVSHLERTAAERKALIEEHHRSRRTSSAASAKRPDFFTRERSRILEARKNVVPGELRKFPKHRFHGFTCSEQIQNDMHGDPGAIEDRLTAADARIESDSRWRHKDKIAVRPSKRALVAAPPSQVSCVRIATTTPLTPAYGNKACSWSRLLLGGTAAVWGAVEALQLVGVQRAGRKFIPSRRSERDIACRRRRADVQGGPQ